MIRLLKVRYLMLGLVLAFALYLAVISVRLAIARAKVPTLCDANASWRPNEYGFDYYDTSLSFRFGMVKLLDYKDRWAELEASDNPFAVVVMTHLKTQETKKDKASRKEWKLGLIKRLYEKGYNREDVVNLFRFIDWMMVLPKGLERSFWTELQTYEEARKVPYITSVEQIGFERGLQEGRQEGEKAVLQRQLVGKFGKLPESISSAVESLSPEAVESLLIALLDFSSIEDLEAWFTQR